MIGKTQLWHEIENEIEECLKDYNKRTTSNSPASVISQFELNKVRIDNVKKEIREIKESC
jgi:hypothetical protein